MRLVTRLGLVLVLVFAAGGCGGNRVNITGTITRDGKPLVWPKPGGHLYVLFVPENVNTRDPVHAEADRETGAYRIAEIRSGTYTVAIQQFDDRHNDALQHKYNPAKTTLRVEVTEDNQVIDIDIPKDLPD